MIGWALETFVATTLLMVLVLLVRAPVRKAFGPGMAYALWLLPVLRLALPPLPESWREQAVAPVAAAGEVIVYYVVEPLGAAPGSAQGSFGLPMAVFLVWIAGAAAFLLYHLISHSRFCAKLLSRARVDRTVADGRVRVIETDAAHGPLAFGIWRKYVAFPRDFSERYDEVERDLALAHELGHHVRGDLIANWVALVVLAIHWFNPVAWKAFRAFRADQEMACDALVLAGRHQALRHAYGRAIVKSAHGGAVSAACHLHTINELKGRLRMLSKTRNHSPIRFAGGIIGVTALSLAALGLTASGTQAAERITSNVEAVTGIRLTGQDAPPPPEPQDPPAAAAAQDAPKPPKVERRVYRIHTDGEGEGHKGKHRVVVTSGADVDVDMAEIDALVPDIKSGNCKEGKPGEMVVVRPAADGRKQRMTICVNRIQAQARDAQAMAEWHKGMGLRAAVMGLRHARLSIEADTSLTPDQKRDALKGIDQAIREIQQEAKD